MYVRACARAHDVMYTVGNVADFAHDVTYTDRKTPMAALRDMFSRISNVD